MSWYFFHSIDGACLSADYCELLQVFTRCQGTLFMAFQASNRRQRSKFAAYQATYLSHPQPVIDRVGTNLYSLVNRELLGVSSLSKAISQKPSRRTYLSIVSQPLNMDWEQTQTTWMYEPNPKRVTEKHSRVRMITTSYRVGICQRPSLLPFHISQILSLIKFMHFVCWMSLIKIVHFVNWKWKMK